MMDWFYDFEISLLGEPEGQLYHGVYREEPPTVIKTIPCDIQPSGREEFYKEYGYYIDCRYTVYCDPDTDIKAGVKVQYNGDVFTVNKLVDWLDYYILYIGAAENE